MRNCKFVRTTLLGVLLLGADACQQMPGTRQQQGAAIGGASGAVAGAVIGGERHRLLGAVLGGALGATGGYVVGARTDKLQGADPSEAIQANTLAQSKPAGVQEVANSATADLNRDGFVTLDEVVAMSAAGLSDEEIIRRLQATGQVFELTDEQKRYLSEHGVRPNIVDQLPEINRSVRNQFLQSQPSGVISR